VEEEEFITERFPTRVGYYTSMHTRAQSKHINNKIDMQVIKWMISILKKRLYRN